MATVTAAGFSWEVLPLSVPEQIEAEVMLVRLFAASAAYAIGAAVQGLAPAAVDAIRDVTGNGESFDLARLLELFGDDEGSGLDTADPRLEKAWSTMLNALAETLGDAVIRAIPAVTDRLDLADTMRLFEMAVLKKAHVSMDGKLSKVADWPTLTKLLAPAGPRGKWDLLRACLGVTYGPGSLEVTGGG
jgi:hypothetical protein